MSDIQPFTRAVRQTVTDYLARFPGEAARLAPLEELLRSSGDVWSRKHPAGHLTASAVIIDPHAATGPAVLLVHHRRLDRWLQPGGHAEAGETLLQSAQREAAEEVGLADLVPHSWHDETKLPIDIDIHAIPANPGKNEPGHFHHDFRYLFLVDQAATHLALQDEEVAGFKWEPFDGPNIPPGLAEALAKARQVIGR